jgi:hypothetical protein
MNFTAWVFGAVLATFVGGLFHLWRGGSLIRLLFYLFLSWIGFIAGQLLANALNWTFLSIGSLHAGMGVLGSLLFLGVGYWLSLVQIQQK